METFAIDSIKKFLIKVNLPSVICIYKSNRDVYNCGIDIKKGDIDYLRYIWDDNNTNKLYTNGLHINNSKYVVVSIEKINDICYVHAKSNEEGMITVIGTDYLLFIYYADEYLPMLHSMKLDKIKTHINFFDRLLV